MRALPTLLCGLALVFPSIARADPWPAVTPEPADPDRVETASARAIPPPARREKRGEWYGWQILVADGSSLMLIPLKVGFVGYLVAAPAVHFGHERWGTGLASAGLRTVGPADALLAVGAMRPCRGALCGHEGLFAVTFAAALAMGIDAAFLAREDAPEGEAQSTPIEAKVAPARSIEAKPQTSRTKSPPAPRPFYTVEPSISPQLTPSRELHGLEVGVAGTF